MVENWAAGECTPRQLGPTTRMPFRVATSLTTFSISKPSVVEVSEKPEVKTWTLSAPTEAQSSSTVARNRAGTETVTISGTSGRAETEGVRLEAENFVGLGVDGINLAGIARA